MIEVIVALLDYSWLLLPVATFCGIYWFYQDLWVHDADWKRVNGWLIQNKPLATYRRLMVGLLDQIDARLSKTELVHTMGRGQFAFSSGLIQLALLLAVVYPMLLVAGQWLFGLPIRFGELEVSVSGGALERGLASFWLAVVFLYALVLIRIASTKKRRLAVIFAMLILFFGLLLWSHFTQHVFPANLVFVFLALTISIMNFEAAVEDKGKSGGSAMFGGTALMAFVFVFSRENEFYPIVLYLFILTQLAGIALILIETQKYSKAYAWAIWASLLFSLIALAVLGARSLSPQEAVTVILGTAVQNWATVAAG